ncbi:MAG TPA: hypothetical protein PLD25_10425 [Chloroflexota bacterium]|nr:hypothetical protein [Chloroflexota bacterium]HUM69147.1 hypothetical protein [Chloroflexota bacterium]
MTNIFSSISGHFGRSLILGTFLPVTIFVILFLHFLAPMLPEDALILQPFKELDTPWQIVTISFATIVLSGFIYNLSIPITRFYEGYPWKDSWYGKRRIKHYQSQFDKASARWKGMRTLIRAEFNSDTNSYWSSLGQTLNTDFPAERNLILPTRLGNVFRGFERYSSHQYGIASITLWPRLLAKIDKEYASSIDDSMTSFDFMLNSSALCGVLSIAIIFTGLIYPIPLYEASLLLSWLFKSIAFALLSYSFYVFSISRAVAWGNMVKGAFDLYRWDLLQQLGYKHLPTNLLEERAIWDYISKQMIYGDHPSKPTFPYQEQETSLRVVPKNINIEVTKGFKKSATDNKIEIVFLVKNTDEQDADHLVVTDTVPSGYCFQWDSLNHGAKPIIVKGTNPYYFVINGLASKAEEQFSYCICPLK